LSSRERYSHGLMQVSVYEKRIVAAALRKLGELDACMNGRLYIGHLVRRIGDVR
jgi:hypothetical protein